MNRDSIKNIPSKPGVYFFKDALNRILYIGKATCLRQRVGSYFNDDLTESVKTRLLVPNSRTITYIVTKNELEASLLEADLIKRYQPKYNILLKDGQPFVYLCFTQEALPKLILVRNKKQPGTYFGPFLHKTQARSAYRFIMNTFRLFTCNKKIANGCLEYHLGLCAGSCRAEFDSQAYQCRLALAQNALRYDREHFLQTIHNQIQLHADKMEFEKAQQLHRYAQDVESIMTALQTRYYPTRFHDSIMIVAADISSLKTSASESALTLQQLLKTATPIMSIDCFDISHFQSNALVGSCVRFVNGKPDAASFRRFKIRTLTTQNDYAALQEIVTRRYKTSDDYPDLILIDGGKGQLNAIASLVGSTPIASLAKREERLFSAIHPDGVVLDVYNEGHKSLIALRDYAHHFAINYHRLRRKIIKT